MSIKKYIINHIPTFNKSFIARHRLRFGLGVGIIGSFFLVFSLLTFAKVWEKTFEYYHIPPLFIYIGMPLSYIIICWSIGYIYDTKGIWEMETSHSNTKLNPEFVILCSDIKKSNEKMNEILKNLELLQKRINELDNINKKKDE